MLSQLSCRVCGGACFLGCTCATCGALDGSFFNAKTATAQRTVISQSRLGSFVEACINTAIGFVISMAMSLVVYPAFGHRFTLEQNVGIALVFTIVSVVRGYVVRRWFNERIHKTAMAIAGATSR